MIYLLVAALPLAGFIFCLRRYFVLPPDLMTTGWFLISVALTALLQFFISYAMAMLAFWVLEVSTFIFILFAFEYLASGHLFPLDILPITVKNLLFYTPFPYQMYFPVSIYLGRITGKALVNGLFIQAAWVIAAYCIARFAWSRGIKKYAAVGG
jgi:ABC-2 type transport system permease protein